MWTNWQLAQRCSETMIRLNLLRPGLTNLIHIALLLLAVVVTSPVFEKQENPQAPATIQKR